MRFTFEYLLDHPPIIQDYDFTPLVNYLRGFWLPKAGKIGVWDGTYPRTTNDAEGYHNSMQTAFEQ